MAESSISLLTSCTLAQASREQQLSFCFVELSPWSLYTRRARLWCNMPMTPFPMAETHPTTGLHALLQPRYLLCRLGSYRASNFVHPAASSDEERCSLSATV